MKEYHRWLIKSSVKVSGRRIPTVKAALSAQRQASLQFAEQKPLSFNAAYLYVSNLYCNHIKPSRGPF